MVRTGALCATVRTAALFTRQEVSHESSLPMTLQEVSHDKQWAKEVSVLSRGPVYRVRSGKPQRLGEKIPTGTSALARSR